MRGLGDLEAAVMEVVWRRKTPVTVRDVLEQLNKRRQLAYTTVMTVMDNLFNKGLLTRTMVSRAWRYEAVLSRAEYSAQMMRDVLGLAGDRSAAMAHFIAAMTPEESQELRLLLRRRPRGRP